MSEFMARAKLWTKVGVLIAGGLYLAWFLFANWSEKVTVHFPLAGTVDKASVLLTLLVTAVLGIIGWWAINLVVRTVRQVKEARRQAEMDRLQKEAAKMEPAKAKLSGKSEKSA